MSVSKLSTDPVCAVHWRTDLGPGCRGKLVGCEHAESANPSSNKASNDECKHPAPKDLHTKNTVKNL